MFVCYLDDSDAELSSVATLAGYVASLDEWREFEDKVSPVFENYEVDILHAIDLFGTKKCFDGWSVLKKQSFINELYKIAGEHVLFGISMSRRKSAHKRWIRQNKKNSSMSAYGVCFAAIMHTVCYKINISEIIRENGLSFIVERGHKNNAEIERYFYKFNNHAVYKGIALTISFVGKTNSRAIQLSDMFAFYSRRATSASDRFDHKLAVPMPEIYQIMSESVLHIEKVLSGDIRVSTIEDATNPHV